MFLSETKSRTESFLKSLGFSIQNFFCFLVNISKQRLQVFPKPMFEYLSRHMIQETSEKRVKISKDFSRQSKDFLKLYFPSTGVSKIFDHLRDEFLLSNFL